MKTAAIIPAYNEEKTIAKVLRAAKKSELLDEIIVVDDGSSDGTADMARGLGIRVIKMSENKGKGAAMIKGVASTDADLLFFLDADLIYFKVFHVDSLVKPVLDGEYDMSVGAIDRSNISNHFNRAFQRAESPFSGIRVVKKSFWLEIPKKYKKDYYIESAVTYLAKKKKLRVLPVVLFGVRHRTKESKLGFWRGTKERWKMNCQIVFINLILRLNG